MRSLDEIRALLKRHAKINGRSTPLPGVTLIAASAPTKPVSGVYQPTIALVAQGAKRVTLGNKSFEYGSGQYLVVSVDLPLSGNVTQATSKEPYLAVALTLRPEVIAALLLETAVKVIKVNVEHSCLGVGVSDASPDLLDAITRLLRLIDHPNDAKLLRPMLEKEILWRLLSGEQGSLVRQIGVADSRLSQINLAIQWIRTHYNEPFRVETLAEMAAMSASSLHRHFRAVTSMSPLQFQKQMRLQEARARLIAEAKDVAEIGFEVGYENPSQFIREYRRLFGMSPGRDVKRWRSRKGRMNEV